jgi:hypothetical protein
LTTDEAVRRLRRESRLRVDRERRWRRFFAWCATATLASGFALAAMSAYDVRDQERAESERAVAAAAHARSAEACAERAAILAEIDRAADRALETARCDHRRAKIRLHAVERKLQVIEATAAAGCTEPVPPTQAF